MIALICSLFVSHPASARVTTAERAHVLEDQIILANARGDGGSVFGLSRVVALVHDKVSRDVTSPAVLTLSDGPAYEFGTLTAGEQVEHDFALTNVGNEEALRVTGSGVTAPFAFKGGSFPGLGGTCGDTLAPGASCSVKMIFAPTEAGFANDMLTLTYHDGRADQTVSRAVSGVARPAAGQ